MTPTEEQEAVIYAEERVVMVEARAGSGKSSTLRMLAESRTRDKILYLVFSKANQLEAAGRFPGNTRCMTTHGLCWHHAVRMFGSDQRARAKTGKAYASTVAKHMGCTALMATAALATIDSFCGSRSGSISIAHVPEKFADRIKPVDAVVDLANGVWRCMLDPSDDMKCPHDGYVHEWAMTRPKTKRYTRILVDEFQDLSDVQLQVIEDQQCSVTAVGDSHQQIMQFRHSVNGMQRMEAERHLYLTTSFRFGPPIAAVANHILRELRAEGKQIVGAGAAPSRFVVDRSKPYAVIARTNAALISHAVALLNDARPLNFVGGVGRYRLELMEDAFRLSRGERSNIRDPYIRSFGSLGEMEELAEQSFDPELALLSRIVRDYGEGVPAVVDAIRAKAAAAEGKDIRKMNAVTLGTCHRVKGSEFEQVVLADDFASLIDRNGIPMKPSRVRTEDVNLHYVGTTRARSGLEVSAQLAEWLNHPQVNGRHLLTP